MILAAGEVTRWERAAHREEESHHETHCFSRPGAGLDSSRLGRRRQRSAGIGGGASPYPARPYEDQVNRRREGTHGHVDRQQNQPGFYVPAAPNADDERFVPQRKIRPSAASPFGRGT